jgi:recombination endonuclease VII
MSGSETFLSRLCANTACGTTFETSKRNKKYCSRRCMKRLAAKNWDARNPESKRQSAKKWRDTAASKSYHREWTYSMQPGEFETRLREQDNKCLLCSEPFSEEDGPCVDHDHQCCAKKPTCGKCTRGLIHNSCNRLLGTVNDSLEKIRLAATYLEKYARRS